MNNFPDDSEYAKLIDAHIVRHTVNFTYESRAGVWAGGSGILAHVGIVHGIVTAGHVLHALRAHEPKPNEELIGIGINSVRSNELQAIKMTFDEFRQCPVIMIGGDGGRNAVMGPDLGFVRLPASKINALTALGTSLDLQSQAGKNQAPEGANEFMVLTAGVADEMIGAPVVIHGIEAVPLTTCVLPGELHSEPPSGVYDRIRIEPKGGTNYPKSYEGVSGGGIWAIGFRRDSRELRLLDRRLIGVAYFQTEADAKGERHLIGHGPSSIYRELLPQIAALEREPMP